MNLLINLEVDVPDISAPPEPNSSGFLLTSATPEIWNSIVDSVPWNTTCSLVALPDRLMLPEPTLVPGTVL